MDSTFSLRFKVAFCVTIALKIISVIVFSSGYRDDLFIPFILQFLSEGGNPWENAQVVNDAFPYPPLMLYILSFFLAPVKLLGSGNIVEGILYGFPLLLSDLLIANILIRLFPWQKTEVFIFYLASPIILFSTYMHGQLDIIPTAIFFASIFLLTRKCYLYSAITIGLAISTKFHTVAAIPLVVIYLLNQERYRESFYFFLIPVLIYIGFTIPYIGSEGFQELVVQNEKQKLMFSSYISVGDAKVFLPVLFITAIYLRFATYRKINSDLLYAAIGVLFSIFLLLIEPSPGWFVWLVPFFTIFYIRYFDGSQHYIFYVTLTVLYLIYYMIFHNYEYPQLIFMGTVLFDKFPSSIAPFGNMVFTSMEGVLLASIYQFYKNGILSNSVYTMDRAFVLGIGGDSGAGKSTLFCHLKNMFGEQLLELEGDGDHKWERGDENWLEYTHLDPKANLLHRQAEQVSRLKNRKTIKRSDYDHDTGKFSEADKIKPKDFIVIAGLHPFYLPKMRKAIDLKIFLDIDERLRISWKIQRDQQHRGYSVAQVLGALAQREQDSERYIRPQKQFSDFIIRFLPIEEDKFKDKVYYGILGLEVAMNASIPLDNVIQAFQSNGCGLSWDYSSDLNTQYVRFDEEPLELDIGLYVSRYVTNSSELVSQPTWEKGYPGVIQFLILFAISEMMQERVM